MRYQHQSLAMALLVLITYIRSAPNVGPRLAVLSTIHLEEPGSTALSGALRRHCSRMEVPHLAGWSRTCFCHVEASYSLTLRSSGHPAYLPRKCNRRRSHATHGVMSRLSMAAARYGNSERHRPPWGSCARKGVDTEPYLGAPANVCPQVRQRRWGSFLV